MSGKFFAPIVSIALALPFATALWAQDVPRAEPTADCLATAPEDMEFPFQTDCGYVVVPQDRKMGVQGVIKLPYMRIHAVTPSDKPPLFMLAGGPGGTIIKSITLALLKPDLLGPVLETRDIVLMDQRGTYNSQPYLDCPAYDALPFVALRDGLDAEAMDALARRSLTECIARHGANGVDLAAYTNVENAADVNDVRAALGYEQIAF